MPELQLRGNRKLILSFEDDLRALIFFHIEEHTFARHLLQTLKDDDFTEGHIAPDDGIEKSSFSEATNSRVIEPFIDVFQQLQIQAVKILIKAHGELGEPISIDGSLIDDNLSMPWTDYLPLAMYYYKHFQEKVTIRRVRQMPAFTENELRCLII